MTRKPKALDNALEAYYTVVRERYETKRKLLEEQIRALSYEEAYDLALGATFHTEGKLKWLKELTSRVQQKIMVLAFHLGRQQFNNQEHERLHIAQQLKDIQKNQEQSSS